MLLFHDVALFVLDNISLLMESCGIQTNQFLWVESKVDFANWKMIVKSWNFYIALTVPLTGWVTFATYKESYQR